MELITKQGYKQTEVGLIPEDWQLHSIESLTPVGVKYGIVDGPFGSNLKTEHYRAKGIPIVTSGYVTSGRFIAKNYLYVDESKFKQEKRSAVQGGDIVMAKIGANCGASAILPLNHHESILSGNALKIKIDESKYSTKLIWQFLWGLFVKGDLEGITSTGAQPAISMSNLKKYEIPLPPTLTEQKAIATALSDVDALITSLEQTITKKKAIKQGAMQQLLTPPHKGGKRLPGFEGEWVETNFGKYIFLQGGYAFSSSSFKKDGVPILRISNIQSGSIDLNDIVYSNDNSIPTQFIAHTGDVLIAMSGATTGKIGVYQHLRPSYINQRVGKFTIIENKADLNFVRHITQSLRFEAELTKQIAQGAQPNISGKQIESFVLDFPEDVKEQQAIAQILSDMDTEITQLETKKEKYQAIKQGMMQELLTGKTRLV